MGCKTKLPISMVQARALLKMLAVFRAYFDFYGVSADPGHEDHGRFME